MHENAAGDRAATLVDSNKALPVLAGCISEAKHSNCSCGRGASGLGHHRRSPQCPLASATGGLRGPRYDMESFPNCSKSCSILGSLFQHGLSILEHEVDLDFDINMCA